MRSITIFRVLLLVGLANLGGLARAGDGPGMAETIAFIRGQLEDCSTLGHMYGPKGEVIRVQSDVFASAISDDPNEESTFTEMVKASEVGKSGWQGNKFTWTFRLRDLDPRVETGTDAKLGTEYIRLNCTRGACVGMYASGSSHNLEKNLKAVTFPGCSGGQKERVAKALGRAVELAGGKKSAF